MYSKIWLSKPHFEKEDFDVFKETIVSNWVSTVGPNIASFEKSIESVMGENSKVVALNSGTSAIHLALKLLEIGSGDEVLCQTFTFCATVNPILYCGATPIFIESEKETWNICPVFLEEAIKDRLKKKCRPKAIVVVDSYGMPAKWDEILAVSRKYGIPVIEDAAAALGSMYKGQMCGTFGDYSILSFNGNKIITTSSGGALICREKYVKERAIYLATQAKIEGSVHGEVGFNYRMSNVLAAIGLEQLTALEKRVQQRRENHSRYQSLLETLDGFVLQEENNTDFYANFWLNCIRIDTSLISKSVILKAFSKHNIDVRSLWCPLHLQPYLKKTLYYGDHFSQDLFETGLCLPSSSNLIPEEFDRICQVFTTFLK